MRAIPFNEEVLFADERVVTVGHPEIDSLKEQAKGNKRQRMRICTHRNIDDTLHEMLIVHQKEAYVRPHRHLNKIESAHIVEGLVDLVIFDEEGNVTQVVQMGDYASGLTFYHRIADPYYHTLLIRSDVLVFHETTNGPFKRSDTEFPPWAPEERDNGAVIEFRIRLDQTVARFISGPKAGGSR